MNVVKPKRGKMIYLFTLSFMFFELINSSYSQVQNASQIKNKTEMLTKEEVLKALSKSLSKEQLKSVEPFISQSFQGINQNNKTMAIGGIKNFKDFITNVARDNDPRSDNKWQDCGTYCDPKPFYEYGFCYWKCIANGGPSKIVVKNVKVKDTH